MRGAGKHRSRGGGDRDNLERDMEDRMTRMRLRLLEEKLEAERQSAASSVPPPDDSHRHMEAARSRQAELSDLLERERQLADRLRRQEELPHRQQRRRDSSGGGGSPRQRRRGDDGRGDRFGQMMEMMMMQNSQMHNLMLNQMMARHSGEQQQLLQPPPPPPPQQPVFLPMPGYETFMQQQQRPWGPPERARDEDRRKKPAEPEPKTATPAKESPKAAAKPESEDEEEQVPFPFPGNKSQQKLRRLAYTAFFLASLNRLTNENKFRPRFDFLFDVRLKEMLETLHRIYKTPDGPLYSITFATVMGNEAMELTELMNVPKTLGKDEERVVAQELAYCIENTVFQVTDIMPSKGILGTHRKSGTFELIRSGNLFPNGYFYDIEKDTMEFDEDGRTGRVTDCNARMLLIGLFLMRALVETLYLKTEHYGMVVETTQKAERNIRLVATVLTYIYRKIVGQLTVMDQGTKKARVSIPDVPTELSRVMHTDQEIRPVLRVAKKSLDYANNLLMHWSEEYVKRLRDAGFT